MRLGLDIRFSAGAVIVRGERRRQVGHGTGSVDLLMLFHESNDPHRRHLYA